MASDVTPHLPPTQMGSNCVISTVTSTYCNVVKIRVCISNICSIETFHINKMTLLIYVYRSTNGEIIVRQNASSDQITVVL